MLTVVTQTKEGLALPSQTQQPGAVVVGATVDVLVNVLVNVVGQSIVYGRHAVVKRGLSQTVAEKPPAHEHGSPSVHCSLGPSHVIVS